MAAPHPDSDWSSEDDVAPPSGDKNTASSTTQLHADLFGSDSDGDDGADADNNAANLHQDLFGSGEDEGDDGAAGARQRDSQAASGTDDDEKRRDDGSDVSLDDAAARQRHRQRQREKRQRKRLEMDLTLPRIPAICDKGGSVYLAKVPNFLHVESAPFDPDTFEDEVEGWRVDADGDDEANDDIERVKLKVENTIRWRFEPGTADKSMSAPKQTNARFVRWSDGTMSLMVGHEIFDVTTKTLVDQHQYLFLRQTEQIQQSQGRVDAAMFFRPATLKSITHKKLTATVLAKHQKVNKTKMFTMLRNPEAAKKEAEKLEADKLKFMRKMDQQKRRNRRSAPGGSLTERALEAEEDMSDYDDYEGGQFDHEFRGASTAAAAGRKKKRDLADVDMDDEGELSDFVVDDDFVEEFSDSDGAAIGRNAKDDMMMDDDDDNMDDDESDGSEEGEVGGVAPTVKRPAPAAAADGTAAKRRAGALIVSDDDEEEEEEGE